MMTIRCKGDGWTRAVGGRAMRMDNRVHHSEQWVERDGAMVNIVPKRKSKKKFPDLPPIPFGP